MDHVKADPDDSNPRGRTLCGRALRVASDDQVVDEKDFPSDGCHECRSML